MPALALIRCEAKISRAAGFQPQQRVFARETTGVAGQIAIGANHTMAGYDNRYRVAPIGRAHGARCAGLADALRQCAIVGRRAVGNFLQCAPHPTLKCRAGGIDRQVEVFAFAGEIFVELFARPNDEFRIRLPLPIASDGGIIFLADKMQPRQRITNA